MLSWFALVAAGGCHQIDPDTRTLADGTPSDDAAAPSQVELCPATCERVRDALVNEGAQLFLLAGCTTVVAF